MTSPSGRDTRPEPVDLSVGEHFSCSMSAVLLSRVERFGGDDAVQTVLRRAGSPRTRAYLSDLANWISYDEAVALWAAGAQVTHHPRFARAVGEDAALRLNGSPLATLLRSLGSPENVYRQIAVAATRYSTVIRLEAGDCRPGSAELIAHMVEGFPRSSDHCEWTRGLLATATRLFGLPLATVEHETCAAFGAAACHYHVRWSLESTPEAQGSSSEVDALREELTATRERLRSMYQTVGDLTGTGELDVVLARIAERAATEVRVPRHLLAVRMTPDGPLRCYQEGFSEVEAGVVADRLMTTPAGELPGSWLAVPVRSSRSEYGYLLAAYPDHAAFLPQERELIQVYARYAASALDGASALREAESRYSQSSALLQLARALAVAGTSAEIARRLADSVPVVVDCDQVAVYVWNGTELIREAATDDPDAPPPAPELAVWAPSPGSTLEALLDDPRPDPIFIDGVANDPEHTLALRMLGFEAAIIVPLVSSGQLLGVLAVAVRRGPERLRPTPDLLNRLSGVGAQAGTALQNGRLVDLITYQALHDQLTGLANRVQLTTVLGEAIGSAGPHAELVALFYIDLDRFKPVNDAFGHKAGDELLVAVADRLRSCTRTTDVVARLGGDEFAVLVVAPTEGDVEKVAHRLTTGFDEPFRIGDQVLTLDVSVGRSTFPADATDADGLLRRADEAMFVHKRRRRSGRGLASADVSRPQPAPATARVGR